VEHELAAGGGGVDGFLQAPEPDPALSQASDGINPVAEPVKLQIGSYAVIIPPGYFTKKSNGSYVYSGVLNNRNLSVQIAQLLLRADSR